MRWLPATVLAVLLTVVSVSPDWVAAQPKQPSETAPKAPSFSTDIRPLLTTYCFECHNTTKKKAGLDLDKLATEAAALEKPAVWDQVGERVRAREMPPGKSKQPNDDTNAANQVEADGLAAIRRRLLVAVPGPKIEPRDGARKVLESFLPRAFRRPATAREVERYVSLFDKASQRGDSYEQALKLA